MPPGRPPRPGTRPPAEARTSGTNGSTPWGGLLNGFSPASNVRPPRTSFWTSAWKAGSYRLAPSPSATIVQPV